MGQDRKQQVWRLAIRIGLPIALLTGWLGLPLPIQAQTIPQQQAQVFPDITTPFAQRILWAEFLINVGLVEDGLRIYDQEIEGLLLRRDDVGAVEFAEGLAAQFHYKGQTDLALRYYLQAQAIHSTTSQISPYRIHQLAQALGAVYQSQGEWQAAADLYTATLKQPADPFSTATTLFHQGRLQHRQGQLTAALATYEQAIAQYQAVESGGEELPVLNAIALIDQAQGDTTTAQARYQEALALAARVTEPRLRVMYQIMILDNIAPSSEDAKSQRAALVAAEADPRQYWSDSPNLGPLALALAMVELGQFYLHLAQGERAEAYFAEALTVAEQSYNTGYDPLMITNQVVSAYRKAGAWEQAIAYQEKAISIIAPMHLSQNAAVARQQLGDLQQAAGAYQAALTTYQDTLKNYQALATEFDYDTELYQAAVWVSIAHTHQRQGDNAAAAAAYERAFNIYQQAEAVIQQVAVLEQWATLEPVRGDDLLRQAQTLRQHPDFQGPSGEVEEKLGAKYRAAFKPIGMN